MTPTDDKLSKLCLRCGMCCDGTLFARVPVSSPERDRLLASRGLRAEPRPDGTFALPQRCAALEGCTCTAYDDRPARCREYRCNLYTAVEASEVDLQEATEVIACAQRLIAQLGWTAFGADDDGASVVSRLRIQTQDGAELSPEARVAFSLLQRYLDRHFRGRRA